MTEDHDRIKKRAAPIAMDAESFRRAGHALVDSISEFLETLPQRPVTPDESPDTVRGVIDADSPLPEEGTDAGALLQRTAPLLFDHSLFVSFHPYGAIPFSP